MLNYEGLESYTPDSREEPVTYSCYEHEFEPGRHMLVGREPNGSYIFRLVNDGRLLEFGCSNDAAIAMAAMIDRLEEFSDSSN